jgi:hypothetical protein
MSEFDQLLEQFKEQRAAAEKIVEQFNRIIKLMEEVRLTLNTKELLEFGKRFSSELGMPLREPVRTKGILSPSEISGLAKSILLERGRPMKRRELLAEMEKRNIPIAGTDKNKNLGTILWRHRNEFVHIEKLGYWPKDTRLNGLYEPVE